MDFELTDEQQLIRDAVREFAEAEIVPMAAEIDRDHRFPAELLPKLAEMNLMGMTFPEKEGGAGSGLRELRHRHRGDFAGVREHRHHHVVAQLARDLADLQFGTRAQQDQYMHDMTSGRRLGAFALTEPAAGTDAAAGTTTAVPTADGYASTDRRCSSPTHRTPRCTSSSRRPTRTSGTRGISAFIVEKDTPGFAVGEAEHKMGIRGSSTPPLYFTDMRIPKEALLGEEGEGFKIAMATLDGGRIGVSAQALGIAQAALDAVGRLCEGARPVRQADREPAGHSVDDRRHAPWRSTRPGSWSTGPPWCVDSGLPYSTEGAMAKLFASETATRVAGKAIQIHGGYGYTESLSGGAALPRRQDHRTLRGDLRGAANGHREKRPAMRTTGHRPMRWPPSGGS